jgi:hypothetical protein
VSQRGERRALAQAHADHLVQQCLVAELGAQAGEPRGDLGVEDAVQLGGPLAAQQGDVLAPGVQDDLDVGVGQQSREAAPDRTPRSADRGPRRARPSPVSTAIWIRHSSAR